MTQELKNLVEEAKSLNNNELNTLVIATIHMQKKVLGYGGKVPTAEEQENIGEICKNTIRRLIDKYIRRSKKNVTRNCP